jgi:fatty acid desaturase
MTPWLALLAASLAAFRIARLVVADSITARPRSWLVVRSPRPLGELLSCEWCVSVWAAGALTAGLAASGIVRGWWLLWLGWPAIAGLAGLFGSWSRR